MYRVEYKKTCEIAEHYSIVGELSRSAIFCECILIEGSTPTAIVLNTNMSLNLEHPQPLKKNSKFNSLNPFLISYAVIKACGVIEVVYKNLIVDVISVGTTTEGKNYFEKNIRDSSSNPSIGNIQRLLQDLNTSWAQQFENQVKGKEEKGSLSSLVGLRNDFAHVRSVTASIGNVKKYFEDGRSVLTWLESIICST